MTRATTWANSDGLNVGFGTNVPERILSGDAKDFGGKKVAKIHITYQSTFGNQAAGGAFVTIPANSQVSNVYLKVTTNWAGGTSLAFGDAGGTGSFITATQGAEANLVTTASPITAGGAYLYTSTEGRLPAKVYSAATDLYVTSVGAHTAGEADIYVEYE